MKNENKKIIVSGAACLLAFIFWSIAVRFIDVCPVGPEGSSVGFASLNTWVHNFFGVNMMLYTVTDWLGLVPVGVAAAFGVSGLIQLITRRSIWQVDFSIRALGVFYIAVIALYLLFEELPVNYRPILINNVLEVSYPSSTTLLVTCVMPTALIQLNSRVRGRVLSGILQAVIIAFTAFMVIGRLVSGVHWLSDIIGGLFLSSGLVILYYAVCRAHRK